MCYLEVNTRIAGIPAIAAVNYSPPMNGGREIAPEPEEWDIEILDRRGRPAPWLASKIDAADIDDIQRRFHRNLRELRSGYD